MIQGTGILIPPSDFLTGELVAPAGTRIPFNQSAPPLGWTTDASASYTDCVSTLRAASGGTSGGATAWSSWNFGGTINANAYAITVANMPAHSHGTNDPTHNHIASDGNNFMTAGTNGASTDQTLNLFFGFNLETSTNAASANASIGNAGSGTPITPQIVAPQVKYTDFIIGVRS